MNNWKISVRLMVLVGVLSVVLVGIGSFGLVSLSRSNEALKSVYEDRMVPLGQLEEMGQKATRNRVLVMDMIIRSHPDNVEKRDAELKANIEDINKLWAQYTATTLTPEEKALADEFVAARKAYVQQGLLPARDAVRAGQPDEADRIYQEKVSALATPFRAAQKKLVQLHIDVARQEYEQAVARFETVRTVSLVVIVLGVVLSVLLGLSMIRGIARALTQAVQAAQAVAQGDLSQQVRVYGRDEIAQLLTALAAAVNMLGNLGAGRLLQRGVAPARLLAAGFGVMALSAAAAFAGEGGAGLPPAWRYVAVLLFSTLGGMIPATLFALAIRVSPGEQTVSTTVGWMQQWSAFGQFAGPPMVAWLAARAGSWQWTWLATGSASMAGLLLAWGLSRRLRDPLR